MQLKKNWKSNFFLLLLLLILSILTLCYGVWKVENTSSCSTGREVFIKSVARGEQFVVCVFIISAVILEMVRKKTDYKLRRIAIIGFSVFILLFSVLALSDVARNNVGDIYIAATSFSTFCGTFLICLASIIFPRRAAY